MGVEPTRLLLKASGEALSGEGGHGIDADSLGRLVNELAAVADLGVELAVVIGGGNLVRGAQLGGTGIDRVSADFIGMLATVMNAMAIRSALEDRDVDAVVLSALEATRTVETYDPRRCVEHLRAGRIAVLAGGTGNPFFTTDTCAALRAAEIGARWLLKGTKVDGIYSSDPKLDPRAERFDRMTFAQALERRLEVMDATAFAFCRENGIAIRVFDMFTPGNIARAVRAEVGTVVVPE